jgi:hypothetical protein
VRKAFRRYASAGQAIVTDRRGGAKSFINVTRIEQLFLAGMMPHTPAKQSACNSSFTDSALAPARLPLLLRFLHLPIDAEQVWT